MTRKPTAWSVLFLVVAICGWGQERDRDGGVGALWRALRVELQSDHGVKYFEQYVKDCLIPGSNSRFSGRLVSMRPQQNPRELRLAVEQPETQDAILKLERPLRGTMPIGSILKFQGMAAGYTAEPYSLTFVVDPKELVGWTGK